jgi:hypothetical protein
VVPGGDAGGGRGGRVGDGHELRKRRFVARLLGRVASHGSGSRRRGGTRCRCGGHLGPFGRHRVGQHRLGPAARLRSPHDERDNGGDEYHGRRGGQGDLVLVGVVDLREAGEGRRDLVFLQAMAFCAFHEFEPVAAAQAACRAWLRKEARTALSTTSRL